MYRYKKILAGVKLDDRDDVLVRYAELVSFMAQSERARFVHAFPAAAAFSDLYTEYALSHQEAVAELREHLGGLIEEKFVGPQSIQ